MKLKDLLSDIDVINITGNAEIDVTGIESDSRKAKPGSLFVAIKGFQVDGHQYIQNALDLGAKTIIHEEDLDAYKEGITYVKVADTADAAGKIATHWYGNPTSKLKLVGVTGTNGKTTTATLLYEMFRRLGYKAGLLSTVCNYVDGETFATSQTTPDPLTLNRLLARMVEAGCEYAFMEVSSHAVHQKRISGLVFAGAIFTNLTQDHLDYHPTMADYLKAKKAFFDNLPSTAFALTNIDDKNGLIMLQNSKAAKHTYSVRSLADFKARIIEKHFDGTTIEINNRELEVQFVGVFNVYNLLAVYGATLLLGQDAEKALVVLSTLKPVSGRFETIRSPQGFTAIVDYAHTPDALTNVLDAIHEVLEGRGRVLTVVGCGGNRDRTKRPIMAREAVRLSDQVILTSDNPRYEEPQAIINDMADGLDSAQMKKTLLIVDREQAIKTACTIAKEGDVVLIAGKGHEDYQDVRGVKHHFDDREVVKSIFEE
ncbi:UDP-N-acetylmuramoyl-L-alanyl-D-glutamate--2,6-diaminopimelate ligase [Dysgonomonas sp. PH5-45]|uniref:UDP-N-acetylmuramoyl-L-alanyl-D-glutamate--2, 6-diaminopimelate ligase n=1 Tax=unclassified Dysgonomonas TaxID=2630389 RepID=UPI0024757F83|nr:MULTISPECIES: UDP-N-acetylmuramoyl-L-alanyl-D-glutamate--2,6-diaminopimelate ligase [unclassified Dysgonomonas]MDH6355715.1 UDP-N-acetylmuramoyl-L-alanyl-D-glutamate--2,6-diaminopimelate ligase [Dysgonomonas sp. PH5-45]MDH6388612.1 UDP-N-acetylmuramoyl-L-alanyl-D-glutamate--2,6-diaminopimelate ligase [Dysgonomonas sp. PH5-37]